MFETLYFRELVGMIWSFEALTVKLFVLSILQFLFIVFELMRKFFLWGSFFSAWYAVMVTHKKLTRTGKQEKNCGYIYFVIGFPRKPQPKPSPGAALGSTFLPVRWEDGYFPTFRRSLSRNRQTNKPPSNLSSSSEKYFNYPRWKSQAWQGITCAFHEFLQEAVSGLT